MPDSHQMNGRHAPNGQPAAAIPSRAEGSVLVLSAPAVLPCAAELRRHLAASGDVVIEHEFGLPAEPGAASPRPIPDLKGAVCLALPGYPNVLIDGLPNASSEQFDALIERSVPLVIAPGELDGFYIGKAATLPVQYTRRLRLEVSPTESRMRTNVVESARLGRRLAEQINRATAPVAVCLPLRGLSPLDAPGQPFFAHEANMTLFGNLTTHLHRDIQIFDCNVNITDPMFARLCFDALHRLFAD